MMTLVAGTVLLSVIHAAIPNHWMPFVVLSQVERWSLSETVLITLLAGLAHSASTVALGLLIGSIGYSLSQKYLFAGTILAPLILIFMGLLYFSLDWKHTHHEHVPEKKDLHGRPRWMIIAILSGAMFFSPCLEIESYFFTAGAQGWNSIWLVAALYPLLSVGTMVLLVLLGRESLLHWKGAFLERHERKITGATLILMGIVSCFWK
jgi:hypothetical protein